MTTFTMITRHGASKDNITGYTLISSEYQTVTVDAKTLIDNIVNKKIVVTNLAIENGKLVSTNGAVDKYTFINSSTNMVEGTPRAVILDRVEANGKLLGYTVFTQMGTLAEVNVADAVKLCNSKLLSNGKIRHTESGDIVSAIGGNFNLRQISIDKAPKGKTTVNLMYFSTDVNTKSEYFGAIVDCTSAAEIARISNTLAKSNANLIGNVAKIAGQSVRSSLAIQRFGANSMYGVFTNDMLAALIKNGATVEAKMGNILVSTIKYDNGDVCEEATAKLSKAFDVVETKNTGDATVDKTLANYVTKLREKFKGTIS